MPVEAWVPLLVLVIAFQVFCVVDVIRSPSTRHLPRWAWVLVCLAVNLLGGVLYLMIGRESR